MSKYRTHDLVVVVADHHAEMLVRALIERGQERGCIAPIAYEVDLQYKKHDAFFRFTEQFLPRDLPPSLHLILCWDHKDCGRTGKTMEENERYALDCLARHGVPEDRALCLAFNPELEAVYTPHFPRVKEILAKGGSIPVDSAILRKAQNPKQPPAVPVGLTHDEALARYPKEMLTALAVVINQRTALGAVHGTLTRELGIARLKEKSGAGAPIERMTAALSRWFPGKAARCDLAP